MCRKIATNRNKLHRNNWLQRAAHYTCTIGALRTLNRLFSPSGSLCFEQKVVSSAVQDLQG
jgi:hypothetical protein